MPSISRASALAHRDTAGRFQLTSPRATRTQTSSELSKSLSKRTGAPSRGNKKPRSSCTPAGVLPWETCVCRRKPPGRVRETYVITSHREPTLRVRCDMTFVSTTVLVATPCAQAQPTVAVRSASNGCASNVVSRLYIVPNRLVEALGFISGSRIIASATKESSELALLFHDEGRSRPRASLFCSFTQRGDSNDSLTLTRSNTNLRAPCQSLLHGTARCCR